MPASAGIVLFAAPALGPAIGGLLISGFGWRSVFLINLPVGLLALAAARTARTAIPGVASGDPGARLDGPGLVLLAAGLGLATYGASQDRPMAGCRLPRPRPAPAGSRSWAVICGESISGGSVTRRAHTRVSGRRPRSI